MGDCTVTIDASAIEQVSKHAEHMTAIWTFVVACIGGSFMYAWTRLKKLCEGVWQKVRSISRDEATSLIETTYIPRLDTERKEVVRKIITTEYMPKIMTEEKCDSRHKVNDVMLQSLRHEVGGLSTTVTERFESVTSQIAMVVDQNRTILEHLLTKSRDEGEGHGPKH